MNLIMTLKDKTQFVIDEIVYTKLYDSHDTAFLLRIKCTETDDLQQLFYDLEAALTPDNISEVVMSVDDGSRPDNTFNFTSVSSVDFKIVDAITVLEAILK